LLDVLVPFTLFSILLRNIDFYRAVTTINGKLYVLGVE
jgi:hypothetical protein